MMDHRPADPKAGPLVDRRMRPSDRRATTALTAGGGARWQNAPGVCAQGRRVCRRAHHGAGAVRCGGRGELVEPPVLYALCVRPHKGAAVSLQLQYRLSSAL